MPQSFSFNIAGSLELGTSDEFVMSTSLLPTREARKAAPPAAASAIVVPTIPNNRDPVPRTGSDWSDEPDGAVAFDFESSIKRLGSF